MLYINKQESIGERIRHARKSKNFTISYVSKETGLSVGNLSDLENSRSLPSSNTLISLSNLLSVSNDWILLGKLPTNFSPAEYLQSKANQSFLMDSEKFTPSLSSEENEILEGYRMMDDDKKRDLIGFIRVLKADLQK